MATTTGLKANLIPDEFNIVARGSRVPGDVIFALTKRPFALPVCAGDVNADKVRNISI